MDGYDIAQICINGHVITSMAASSPQFKQNRCETCGAETLIKCLKCNQPIKGHYHVSGVFGGFDYDAPRFCDSCGEAYPWIKTKLETACELVDLIDSLSSDEKDDFKNSITELVRETSKIPIAKVKLKKYMAKVDSDISEGIRDVLRDTLSKELREQIIKVE